MSTRASGGPSTVAAASTVAPGAGVAALTDGVIARGDAGAEWTAAATDAQPWVRLGFSTPRRVASVVVLGPSQEAFDPEQSTAAALHGVLRFSDGSTVVVSGIAGGAGMPTTVAFAPRVTSSVRLDLARTVPDAVVGLREFRAYDSTRTPPRWPSSSPGYAVTPPAADCSPSTPSLSPVSPGQLSLACPAPGSVLGARATVGVDAPAGTALEVRIASAGRGGAERRVASGLTDARGRASLTFTTRSLPRGPLGVEVVRAGAAPGSDENVLRVQLLNPRGARQPVRDVPPTGVALRWSDDFDGPLSISGTGQGADYAAVKPEPWGGSQFGEAVFADPAWGAGTLATVPGGYLRVRTQPIGVLAAHQTWGQRSVSGIVSSQRFGGSGFSAQYGYFEARLLGAPGPGAWSAFWMLNSESGTGRNDGTGGELDAVELYGHDTVGVCHTTHSWGAPGGGGQPVCHDLRRSADWAMSWHTYAAQVTPGGARFFVDGAQVASSSGLSHTDEPFFFLLDVALGGGWPVDLSATAGTTDVYVDWVRVYT